MSEKGRLSPERKENATQHHFTHRTTIGMAKSYTYIFACSRSGFCFTLFAIHLRKYPKEHFRFLGCPLSSLLHLLFSLSLPFPFPFFFLTFLFIYCSNPKATFFLQSWRAGLDRIPRTQHISPSKPQQTASPLEELCPLPLHQNQRWAGIVQIGILCHRS